MWQFNAAYMTGSVWAELRPRVMLTLLYFLHSTNNHHYFVDGDVQLIRILTRVIF